MCTLKQIQGVELEILSTAVNILERHRIPYYLVYGSCLGAIRHGGIIPWDDDVDIGLFRKDYESARNIFMEELPYGFTYCDRFTEKEYPYNFAKIRKDNTAFVHAGDAHLKIHHGMYIDLFPLDDSPACITSFYKHYKKVKLLRQLVDLKCMDYKKYHTKRPLWQLPLICISHLLFNKKHLQDALDREIQKFSAPSSGAEIGRAHV